MAQQPTSSLNRFFCPALSSEQKSGDLIVIDGQEAKHISKVMRLSVGDQLTVFGNVGFEICGTISEIGNSRVEIQVSQVLATNREPEIDLTIAAALPKGDRQKMLIEKLTEIGVARFIPLVSNRSVVKPGEQHVEKFRRYVIEASKQCRRNRLMVIDSPSRFEQCLEGNQHIETRLVLHPYLGDRADGEPLGNKPTGSDRFPLSLSLIHI